MIKLKGNMDPPPKGTIGHVLENMKTELLKLKTKDGKSQPGKLEGNPFVDVVISDFLNVLIKEAASINLGLKNANKQVEDIYENLVKFFLYFVSNSVRGLILRGYSPLSIGNIDAETNSSLAEAQQILKYIGLFKTYAEKNELRAFLVKLQNEFKLLNIDGNDEAIISDLRNKCKNSTMSSSSVISVIPKNLDADKEKCKELYAQVQAIREENDEMIKKILQLKYELIKSGSGSGSGSGGRQMHFSNLYKQLQEYIKKEKLNDLLTEEGQNTSSDCDNNPTTKINQLQADQKSLLEKNYVEIFKQLVNFKEDLLGAVRIFVKVKGGPLQERSSEARIEYTFNAQGTLSKPLHDPFNKYIKYSGTNYGPFFDVFNHETTNNNVYQSLESLIQQIESGYHVAIFGYGYSGSGKTYTLIDGTEKDKGLLYAIVDHFIQADAYITVDNVFELYIDNLDLEKTGIKNSKPSLSGRKISHDYINNHKPEIKTIQHMTDILAKIKKSRHDGYINGVQNYKKKPARIKETLNNPESSRSHLFIKFNIGNGGLTICDMGGREDPFEIFHNTPIYYTSENNGRNITATMPSSKFFGETSSFNAIYEQYTSGDWPRYITARNKLLNIKKVATDVDGIMERCKEGVYINETINHLKSYFQFKKTGRMSAIVPCKNFQGYTSEQVFVDPNVLIINRRQYDNIGMITALREMESRDPSKPTKFVMFACIRRENAPKFVEFSTKTLDFAQEIASTT